MVLAGSVWLGGFAYKKVVYSRSLWWHFAFDGDASRFLRASLGALVVLVAFSLVHLLTGADRPPDDGEDPEERLEQGDCGFGDPNFSWGPARPGGRSRLPLPRKKGSAT